MAAAPSSRLDRRPRAPHAVALALALSALLLRLLHLGAQPLWFDEALTAHIAHAPDGLDFVHNTPPLYHWLTRLCGAMFGVGPVALRLPSAVAGAVFVWLAFQAARAVFGPRTALVAGLLALASPLHLYYSQEARAYALLLCELMLAFWMLWRLGDRRDRGRWIVLVLASTAALYTHYLAAIPLAIAHLGIVLAVPAAARRRTGVAVAVAGITAVALLVPWLLWWRAHTPFETSDMRWLALLWSELSGGRAFAATAELFVLGAQAEHAPIFLKQFSSLPFPATLRVATLAAAALLMALGGWRAVGRGGAEWRPMLLCLALAVGPVVCLWLLSWLRPVYCPGRYDLIALPAFVLLLAHAIAAAVAAEARVFRWSAIAATAVLAGGIAVKDWRYVTAPPPVDQDAVVAEYLVAQLQPGEAVVLCGTVGLPVLARLYRDDFVWAGGRCRSPRRGIDFACRLLPSALEQAPAAVSRYLRALEDGSLVADLQQLELPADAAGIWLLLGPELHGAGIGPQRLALVRRLFAALEARGYEFVGGAQELGAAHLVRRQRR